MQDIPLTRSVTPRHPVWLCLILASMLVFGACDGGDDEEPLEARTPGPVFTGGPGPYVSVAVDNHFHDVHPVDDKEIDADDAFVVRNEGSNIHNVTFPGTDISVDVKPGESWRIDPAFELGGPGTYWFFCKFHPEDNMRGRFTIVEEE